MTNTDKHFLGLRTVIYIVDDLQKAKTWYTDVLGFPPYFDEPFYVGFNVGGYELGLLPEEGDNYPGAGGVLAYWGVKEIGETSEWLIKKGAKAKDEIQDVGDGVKVATFYDPFGNVFGVIENPHFKAAEQVA